MNLSEIIKWQYGREKRLKKNCPTCAFVVDNEAGPFGCHLTPFSPGKSLSVEWIEEHPKFECKYYKKKKKLIRCHLCGEDGPGTYLTFSEPKITSLFICKKCFLEVRKVENVSACCHAPMKETQLPVSIYGSVEIELTCLECKKKCYPESKEIKIGDSVIVPSIPGHISNLCRSGFVTAIMKPYCRVFIEYGKFKSGTWHGKISDVEKFIKK